MLNIAPFIHWVQENGGFIHQDIEISHSDEVGFHVLVAEGKTIQKGTRVISCPMSTTLSILNVLNIPPFDGHGTTFPQAFIDTQSVETLQHFFLVEQWLLGSNSWWAPYLSTLPDPETASRMYFTDEEDLKWITGTNLKASLARLHEKRWELYETALKQLRHLNWPNAMGEKYTWQLFLWAVAIFDSRGFTSQVLSDTLPADQARSMGEGQPEHEKLAKLFSNGFPVLLPMIDILNYKPGAKVEWQARYNFVGLQVLDQFQQGQEICNNYGPRDNETLMMGYGFAIRSNPFDHFCVGLKIPPGSPLQQARSWGASRRNNDEHHFYVFNIDHPLAKRSKCLEASLFSFDLFDSISVLSANDRELQEMFCSQKTYMESGLSANKFANTRNILHTMSQLYVECEARLEFLQRTNPVYGREGAMEPQNQKQRYANIYLNSQIKILATAIELCKYTLLRAASDRSNEETLQIVREGPLTYPQLLQTEQNAKSNFTKLIKRHTSVIRRNELLEFSSLVKLLPAKLSTNILSFLSVLKADENTSKIEKSSPANRLKIQFAVLLAALESYKITSSVPETLLSARLDAWISELRCHYPLEDPNWTALSQDDIDGDAQERILYLVRTVKEKRNPQVSSHTWPWRTVEKLCWGWNVTSEEGVFIPASIAKLLQFPSLATRINMEEQENANFGDLLTIYIPSL